MTREQARDEINSRLPLELTKAKKRATGYDTYVCPLCGNGSGPDGTGICTKDGRHYSCFKCGFTSLDYLDILKKQHGTASETEIFNLYHLTIEPPNASAAHIPEASAVDYSQYFKTCNARADQTEYFIFRGISQETIARFSLGYDPSWRHPNAPGAPASARVIIPTGRGSYLARATDSNCPKQYQKQKVGESRLFNLEALSGQAPFVYLVEGEFDALSVIGAGGQAVALGSVSNKNKLLQVVKEAPPSATLILSLDNDEAGRKTQAEIKGQLEALRVPCLEMNISGAYKDPNEAWQKDREGFAVLVNNPQAAQEAEREKRSDAYMERNSVTYSLAAFTQGIQEAANTPAVSTGFLLLDEALDGGFYEGLYIVGAVSSIGKTSLCLQIADQIAQKGTDVLIFSLEMSKYELIAKSLSRLTFIADRGRDNDGFFYARTTRQITAGAKYQFYGDREKGLIEAALKTYADYGKCLYIHEGMGNIGVEQIKMIIAENVSVTGRKPVVIIDYLQILAPYDMRATDKQNTDKAVLELKRMSREQKIPVLAISSFNRDNYLSPVNMASFKESGAIEYSSDVLLGFQFEGMDDISEGDKAATAKRSEILKKIEGWKRADPRKMEVKVLKNRNGATGNAVYFDYYPRFNYFHECLETKGLVGGGRR